MVAADRQALYLLAAAMRAYDAAHAVDEWQLAADARRRQADHDHILKPPAPRGYGYATDEDLRHLGYDPDTDRRNDLERWRHDLELAVDAELITQTEGEAAWQSATKNSSSSSTGTTSTTTPTPT
jgi:hypothetical protein